MIEFKEIPTGAPCATCGTPTPHTPATIMSPVGIPVAVLGPWCDACLVTASAPGFEPFVTLMKETKQGTKE